MNGDVENPMSVVSQIYPVVFPETVPQQGEISKRRRRRKKNKGGDENGEKTKNGVMMRKRKLNAGQVRLLEISFGDEHKLESQRKEKLASELGLVPRQVAVWFQNRRARWKNKKLEDEYNRLKIAHDAVLQDKCRLESQVLQLKEQLFESEREIQRLAEQLERGSSRSPTSSPSNEATPETTPFLGDYSVVADGFDNLFYASDNTYMINEMEWARFYI